MKVCVPVTEYNSDLLLRVSACLVRLSAIIYLIEYPSSFLLTVYSPPPLTKHVLSVDQFVCAPAALTARSFLSLTLSCRQF